MSDILDNIKRAIEASGKSRYRIAQESGVSEAQLSRLVSGKAGLSIENIEKLANCLGLEIVIRSKRKQRKGR